MLRPIGVSGFNDSQFSTKFLEALVQRGLHETSGIVRCISISESGEAVRHKQDVRWSRHLEGPSACVVRTLRIDTKRPMSAARLVHRRSICPQHGNRVLPLQQRFVSIRLLCREFALVVASVPGATSNVRFAVSSKRENSAVSEVYAVHAECLLRHQEQRRNRRSPPFE
jgi:hypothetical protein